MFSKEALAKAVRASGYRKRYISDKLGMSYAVFVQKSLGKIDWKVSEAKALQDALGIDDDVRDKIFFAQE